MDSVNHLISAHLFVWRQIYCFDSDFNEWVGGCVNCEYYEMHCCGTYYLDCDRLGMSIKRTCLLGYLVTYSLITIMVRKTAAMDSNNNT